MARTLELTLASLGTVVHTMRDLGILSWCGSPVGDIVLGAVPAKAPKEEPSTKPNARRSYYEDLLNRGVDDKELEKLP